MKKSGPDRRYTDEFRLNAVKQVIDGGRSIMQVARSLEMSGGTLGNWVAKARKGEALMKRTPARPVGDLEAEVARLRQEVSRLRMEKEILKKAAAYFAKESM
jgi:transposase